MALALPNREELGVELAAILARPVGLIRRAITAEIELLQRCELCSMNISAAIFGELDVAKADLDSFRTLALDHLQRSWQLHTCQPVEVSLLRFTNEQLEEMFVALEERSMRLAARAVEVQRLLVSR